MRRRWSVWYPVIFALLVFCFVADLASSWWLPAFGWALVRDDGPAKADLALVLGGDPWGVRISKAGDLVRQGYVPAVLVSGPPGYYDQHECEPEIAWAVRRGYRQEWFIPFPDEARSTQDEARLFLPELQRRNVHRVLIVTTDYHSRRALRIFRATERQMGVGIDIRMVTAPDRDFHPATWWRNREGQKIVFMEFTKSLAGAIGL